MANAIFSFANLADSATLSASDTAGDLSVSNLADGIIQRPWRSSTTTPWIQADLGTNKSIGVVAIAIPRSGAVLGASDTIRLQLDAEGGTPGTGAVYDSGAAASGIVASAGYWLHFFSTPQSARYARLTFSTANAYVQVGRLWIGATFQPAINFGHGWGRQWGDTSVLTTVPKSGLRIANDGPTARLLTLQFQSLTSAEAATLEDGLAAVGTSQQFLVCTDPSNLARTTMLGKIAQVAPITQPYFAQFSHPLTLQEDL